MIRIANPIKIFDSPEFTHPGRGHGNSFDLYYFNHNFGANPKLIQVFDLSESTVHLLPDYERYLNSSGLKYYFYRSYIDNNNQIKMRIYHVSTLDRILQVHLETW